MHEERNATNKIVSSSTISERQKELRSNDSSREIFSAESNPDSSESQARAKNPPAHAAGRDERANAEQPEWRLSWPVPEE